MDRDRTRLCKRSARRARRQPRQELDQRNLHPQHVRRLARLHGAATAPGAGARTAARHRRRTVMSSIDAAAPAATKPRVTRLDRPQCEDFLVHEARLLDDARFHDWLALFTADAWYWVPAQPNQASPRDTI